MLLAWNFGFNSPRIAVKIHILGVAAQSYTLVLGDSLVDGVERGVAESVDQDLEAGQRFAVAGLNGRIVAASCDIKHSDGPEHDVGILAGPLCLGVDVGREVFPVPESLEETQDVGRQLTACALDAKRLCQRVAFHEGPILALSGEKARAGDFFPEVESGRVPRLPIRRSTRHASSGRLTYQYWPT